MALLTTLYNWLVTRMKHPVIPLLLILALPGLFAQSNRYKNYSESATRIEKMPESTPTPKPSAKSEEVIRIDTDLVTVPVRISDKDGRPVPDVRQSEFRIIENGVEQEVAYFQNESQPFTVALMLDMSYSSVFKLHDIQAAADLFVGQLRDQDKVMIVAFDEKVRILCKPTNDRRILRMAIEGSEIGSGTSVYTAIDSVLNEHFAKIPGRKAIVILSDGVDTSSRMVSAKSIVRDLTESDILIYPIQYNTYDDVQKNRRKDAPIAYDEDDRPYVVSKAPGRGERAEDYRAANEFFADIADRTGGRVYKVKSNTNLKEAFSAIADELRKIYSLGYYPSSGRLPGETYSIKVRVYRPNLLIRARESRLAMPGEK
jgi:Ca-activated chloride channel family protein